MEKLLLVRPSLRWEKEYQAMIQEFMATDEVDFNNFPLALSDFGAFIAEVEDEAAGRNLPPGISPQQTYWTIKNGSTLVGEIRLRPALLPSDFKSGHIGYNIRPSERRKGYATQQLSLVLQEARHFGLKRVMLPVRSGNIGSERAIAKNGGVVDEQIEDQDTGEVMNHYWITLGQFDSVP